MVSELSVGARRLEVLRMKSESRNVGQERGLERWGKSPRVGVGAWLVFSKYRTVRGREEMRPGDYARR